MTGESVDTKREVCDTCKIIGHKHVVLLENAFPCCAYERRFNGIVKICKHVHLYSFFLIHLEERECCNYFMYYV